MQNDPHLHGPRSWFRASARRFVLAALALGAGAVFAAAQTPANGIRPALAELPDAPEPQSAMPDPPPADAITLRNTPRNLLLDQKAIWTSPVRLRLHDLKWLAPLALATGAAIATDHHTMTQVVSRDPGFNRANIDTSNVLIGSWIAAPVAIYGYGHFQEDAHANAAGILAGESMLDGVVVEELLKQVFRRERPFVDDARGHFFQSGVGADSSFPSSHSLIAWSAASTLAGEYSSHWTQFALYSAAGSVSLTRVMGQKHFPSDVLVGSSLGWLIGHNVVRRHQRHLISARHGDSPTGVGRSLSP